jgi:hypothetical protein
MSEPEGVKTPAEATEPEVPDAAMQERANSIFYTDFFYDRTFLSRSFSFTCELQCNKITDDI